MVIGILGKWAEYGRRGPEVFWEMRLGQPSPAKPDAGAFLAGNPVNFPHLARVGPLYDKRVSHPLECQLLW